MGEVRQEISLVRYADWRPQKLFNEFYNGSYICEKGPVWKKRYRTWELQVPSYESPQSRRRMVEGGGASPGVGDGIDLIFIMIPTPEEKQEDPLDQFIKDLTKYVKTILLVRQTTYSAAAVSRDQQYREIYNLDDIFDHLAWIVWTQGREKVRRIRIIAHGQMGTGAVKMALRINLTSGKSMEIEPKRKPVLPDELVKKYVEKPKEPKIKNRESISKWEDALRKWESNREIVRSAMTKDALVEFWGCFIGENPEAGSAWSRIFESTFRATSEVVMTGFHYYTLQRQAPVQSNTVPDIRVHNTREIDRLDTRTQNRFRDWLLERYHEFVRNGDVLPIEGEKLNTSHEKYF